MPMATGGRPGSSTTSCMSSAGVTWLTPLRLFRGYPIHCSTGTIRRRIRGSRCPVRLQWWEPTVFSQPVRGGDRREVLRHGRRMVRGLRSRHQPVDQAHDRVCPLSQRGSVDGVGGQAVCHRGPALQCRNGRPGHAGRDGTRTTPRPESGCGSPICQVLERRIAASRIFLNGKARIEVVGGSGAGNRLAIHSLAAQMGCRDIG